jgi:hypothetical protein
MFPGRPGLPGCSGNNEDTKIVSMSVGRLMQLWQDGILERRILAELRGGGTISDSIPEHQHMHLSRELGGGCG